MTTFVPSVVEHAVSGVSWLDTLGQVWQETTLYVPDSVQIGWCLAKTAGRTAWVMGRLLTYPIREHPKVVIGCGAGYVAGRFAWKYTPDIVRGALSESVAVIKVQAVSMVTAPFLKYHRDRTLRAEWQRSPPIPRGMAVPIGHSHGRSALERTAASNAIDDFIFRVGCRPYVVSMSSRDKDSHGFHQWFLGKDYAFQARNDPVGPRDIIKMIDVDYYTDWSVWLCYGRPIILYTFAPTEVHFANEEYSYSLTPNGVEMDVSGGRRYCHQLWDFSVDHVVVWSKWVNWTMCSIDVKSVGPHHNIVFINPICTVRWTGWLINEARLKRRSFAYGPAIANVYRTKDYDVQEVTEVDGERVVKDRKLCDEVISVGLKRHGKATSSATLPVDLWEAIRIRLANSKHPAISDVERYLRLQGRQKQAAVEAPVLFEIAKLGIQQPFPRTSHAPGQLGGVNFRYNAIPDDGLVSEDGREIGRAVAPSLVTHPGVVPVRSYNNDLVTIVGRVRNVLNDRVPTNRFNKFAMEFIRFVVDDQQGVGAPLELQEVIELQDRPTQRGRSSKVLHWIAEVQPVSVQAFMKGESYQKVTDPRNISTVGAAHTLRLSAYTYAFKRDVLYGKRWYAPGKTPRVIAETLSDLVSEYCDVSETDFSRFDGTISYWCREQIERAAYLYWVAPDHYHDLAELLASEINPSATTSCGLPYSPRASRLSGSPLTTDGNTLINAFVSYAAARLAGKSPPHAYALLGIYAGDDGVSPLQPRWLTLASRELGMSLKCDWRTSGHVCFLGRVFYGLGVDSYGSLQDPLRTWVKLHISFAPPEVSDAQALANRAAGYLTLDPCAPVVADWCTKALEFAQRAEDIEGGFVDRTAPYYAYLSTVVPDFGSWPQLTYETGLEAISWRTGIPVAEVSNLAERIRDATVLDELGDLFANEPTEVTLPAVFQGEVHVPPSTRGSLAPSTTSTGKSSRRGRPRNRPRITPPSGSHQARGGRRTGK